MRSVQVQVYVQKRKGREVESSPLAPFSAQPGIAVGVMGPGTDENNGRAAPLGRLIARRGVNLLTGGGAARFCHGSQ